MRSGIFLGASLVVTLKATAGIYTDLGHFVLHGREPLWRWAAWLSDWVWVLAIGSYGTFLFLLFPTGKPPNKRWRKVGWLAAGAITLAALNGALSPGPLTQATYLRNPLSAPSWATGLVKATDVGLPLLALSIALSVSSLVVRARRGDRIVRLQIKWIAYAGFFVVIGFVNAIRPGGGAGFTVAPAVFLFGPIVGIAVASAIAIRRYRLFEIDRLISRTASYVIITALLGGVFALVILVPTAALGTKQGAPSWLVAAATLAVAVLFQPIRTRVQRSVDHRFNRARYDAVNTVESFSARLREQVDMETLQAELSGVIEQTIQPARLGIWMAPSKRS